ncbi:hypothetical protein Tco_0972284 [Tanacetum coccineum]
MKENTSKSKNSDPILELWIRLEAYKKKLEHINVPWEKHIILLLFESIRYVETRKMKENRASKFQYKKLSKRASERIYYRLKWITPTLTMEEYIRLEEEKARRSVETEFPAIVFNDTLTSEATLSCEPTVSSLNNNEIDFRISFDESDDNGITCQHACRFLHPSIRSWYFCFDDLDFFNDLENEFPAIVYNDAQTSKSDFSTEPVLNPQHIDEFDSKSETSLLKCDEEEQNIVNFNDLFSFNVIYPNDSKSDKDNDDDKVDIEHSSGELSVKRLPNVINTDVGAYAHGSNKLLETSHDTSKKIFKTETFIEGLNFNIITWNHLNKGMPFIFLIKNLYVPFGIPFDPKLFYKDGIKLGQTSIRRIHPIPYGVLNVWTLSVFIFSTVYTPYSLNEYIVYKFQYDVSWGPRERNIDEYWWRIYISGDLKVLES